jgi:hypothetical protein
MIMPPALANSKSSSSPTVITHDGDVTVYALNNNAAHLAVNLNGDFLYCRNLRSQQKYYD